MRREQRFLVDPIKGTVSLATLVFLAAISICLAAMAEYWSAAIFGAIGLLFLPQVWQYGSMICFDENGAKSTFCGHTRLFLPWDKIAEVGVAGSRVFNTKKDPGTLYLYLSPDAMTEEDRFQMVLRFPPKEKIALVFTEKAYKAMQLYWEGTVCTYHTGDRKFF